MSRKYLLDCTASGAKWADDVHSFGGMLGMKHLYTFLCHSHTPIRFPSVGGVLLGNDPHPYSVGECGFVGPVCGDPM